MAKRETNRRRKEEKRKKKLRTNSKKAKLHRRVKEIAPHSNIVVNPTGATKMSELLLDFADPLLEISDDDLSHQSTIGLASVGWNLALLPKSERKIFLNKFVRDLSPGDQEDAIQIKDVIEWLIQRKTEYFSEHNRFILGYEFTGFSGYRRLNVVSTIPSNLV